MEEGTFAPALALLDEDGVFGPKSFQEYVKEHELGKNGTWDHISVDVFTRLKAELREAGTMVYRLGSAKGKQYTDFALVRSRVGLNRHFLFFCTLGEKFTTLRN